MPSTQPWADWRRRLRRRIKAKNLAHLPLLRVGTDYSGIDAPIIGLRALRIPHRLLFASESNAVARRVHELNFSTEQFFSNAETKSALPRKLDLYVAGPPCQPFSSNAAGRGFQDPRSNGLDVCIETIRRTAPRAFVLENLPRLIGPSYKSAVEKKLAALKNYDVHFLVLNSKDFGVPQHRRRLYIVGLASRHLLRAFQSPKPWSLQCDVSSVLDSALADKQKPRERRIVRLCEGRTREPFAVVLARGWLRAKADRNACRTDGLSPTLLSSTSLYVSTARRRLAGREYLRLQGCPDAYRLPAGLGVGVGERLAANTMTVPVISAVLIEVLACVRF